MRYNKVMHKHHMSLNIEVGQIDPSNLMEVTIEEHAELHLAEYLTYGLPADWVAYHMLSGQTEEGERARISCISFRGS